MNHRHCIALKIGHRRGLNLVAAMHVSAFPLPGRLHHRWQMCLVISLALLLAHMVGGSFPGHYPLYSNKFVSAQHWEWIFGRGMALSFKFCSWCSLGSSLFVFHFQGSQGDGKRGSANALKLFSYLFIFILTFFYILCIYISILCILIFFN